MPALQRGDGVAPRHLAVPPLQVQARLLRGSVAGGVRELVSRGLALTLGHEIGQQTGDHQDEQRREQQFHDAATELLARALRKRDETAEEGGYRE